MTSAKRAVEVRQLPERSSGRQAKTSLRELQNCLRTERPRVVLDCSNLRQPDGSAIHLLLCCLEEAMKRNGDIKLAALPPEARAVLHATGLDRLFELHDTIADAVNSYHHLSVTQIPANQRSKREAKSAA